MSIRSIHEKLGTAGFIISIIALVAALGGSAFAAKGALTHKQKKEVEKIAKKYAGKPGPAGATGAKGDAGPKGDAGAQGANGATGAIGAQGPVGASGTPGPQGLPGESAPCTPSHPQCTLPSGVTETGTWSASQSFTTPNRSVIVPISFPIPLEEAGEEGSAYGFTRIQTEEEKFGKEPAPFGTACKVEAGQPSCIDTGCTGTVAEPTAPPGVLCIYSSTVAEEENLGGENFLVRTPDNSVTAAYGTTGAVLYGPFSGGATTAEAPAYFEAFGSWAVTAP